MALFVRNNTNALSFINQFCVKFASTGSPPALNVKNANRFDNVLAEIRKIRKKATLPKRNVSMSFDSFIKEKRKQAEKSILVELKTINSFESLHNLCSAMGNILFMHHYQISQTHYVLIEFQSLESVKTILDHTSSLKNNSLYFKTSALYYDKNSDIPLSNFNHKLMVKDNVRFYCNRPIIESFVAQELHKCFKVSDQIDSLYKMTKLTDFTIRLRFQIAWQLEQCLSGLFHNTFIHPFGSSVNGFGRRDCDLDLVLNFYNSDTTMNDHLFSYLSKIKDSDDRKCMIDQMNGIADILTNFIPGIHSIRRIMHARVPIIKFVHEYTNIECDLSMGNVLASRMTELLYLYGQIDIRVKPLVFIVRTWARVKNITNDAPGRWITNFSLSLLVIFYLQQKHILPTLNDLISCTPSTQTKSVVGNNCSFTSDVRDIPPTLLTKNADSLEDLLYDFFDYYSCFNFNAAISLREGTTVSKREAAALYICNPLEPHLNVSKNVSGIELDRIKNFMKEAAYVLATKKEKNGSDWGLLSLLNLQPRTHKNKLVL